MASAPAKFQARINHVYTHMRLSFHHSVEGAKTTQSPFFFLTSTRASPDDASDCLLSARVVRLAPKDRARSCVCVFARLQRQQRGDFMCACCYTLSCGEAPASKVHGPRMWIKTDVNVNNHAVAFTMSTRWIALAEATTQ